MEEQSNQRAVSNLRAPLQRGIDDVEAEERRFVASNSDVWEITEKESVLILATRNSVIIQGKASQVQNTTHDTQSIPQEHKRLPCSPSTLLLPEQGMFFLHNFKDASSLVKLTNHCKGDKYGNHELPNLVVDEDDENNGLSDYQACSLLEICLETFSSLPVDSSMGFANLDFRSFHDIWVVPSSCPTLLLDETLVHSTLEEWDDSYFTFSVFSNMEEQTVYGLGHIAPQYKNVLLGSQSGFSGAPL
ncbi:hypothetical protein ZIOFF_051287 [Zingiber officinale]|uniref:Uncharacterized protein n=1 Tax=Zingiber officinale TaxID=94328 RepID=A0A8J5KH70_ZINOF|nr:hypothetical protein ZIOFF_051287 [Zingiber officinale]